MFHPFVPLSATSRRRAVGLAGAAAALFVALLAPLAAPAGGAQALEPFPPPRDFATWHEVPLASPGGAAGVLMTDAAGDVWYDDSANHQLVSVDPATGIQSVHDLGPVDRSVSDLVETPDGNVWFSDYANAAIVRYDTLHGGTTSFSLGGPFDNAFSLVLGPDGALWFGAPSMGGLGRIDLTGSLSFVPVPRAPLIFHLVSAPDGRLWFTEDGLDTVVAYDPVADRFTETPLGLVNISGLAVARDDTLWVGGSDALANVTLGGAITILPVTDPVLWEPVTPVGLIAGEHAQLYFTDEHRGIGRIDSAGTLTFMKPPFAGTYPSRLTVDHTGSLWYTDWSRHTIGWV